MKLTAVLLAVSVAANVGLFAIVLLRMPDASSSPFSGADGDPSSVEPAPSSTSDDVATTPVEATDSRDTATNASAATTTTALWKRLHDDDPNLFEKNLRAAGLPEHVVNALLAADARERVRSRQGNPSAAASTRISPTLGSAVAAPPAVASNLPIIEGLTTKSDPFGRRLEFIDPSRRGQAQAIARDYDAMIADVKNPGGTLLTDTEKQMIATLEAERRRDLERLLTPRELADFEMVKSPLFSRLAHETREFTPTPDEFRTIFALEKSFAERYGTGTIGTLPPRREDRDAAAQLRATMDDQLLVLMGTDRFAEYDRSRNYEYRELSQLARRVNIPATVAAEVFSMRDYVSAESNRIFSDAGLSVEQKRSALQSLAVGTRAQILQRLGNEAGTTYLRMADRWLTPVEQGSSVTFKSTRETSFRRLPTARPTTTDGG